MKLFLKYSLVVLLSLFSFVELEAQIQKQPVDVEYGVALDTNIIVIGDQINMTVSVKVPKGITANIPVIKDTITKGLEILEKGSVDTLKLKDGWRLIKQDYLITSFDTGVYKIPSYVFVIKNKGFDNVVRSDELMLGVTTFNVDLKKGVFDIIQPKDTPINFAEILPYILWSLLIIAVILIVIFLFKKFKSKESIFKKIEKPKEPAHLVAIRELERIKSEKLWTTGDFKDFYTELTDTLRVYLEDEFGICAMEKTSIDILDEVRANELINDDVVDMFEDILLRADFVKFAKAQPIIDENIRSLDYSYKIVSKTHKIVEEMKEAERLKEEKKIEEEERLEKERQEKEDNVRQADKG